MVALVPVLASRMHRCASGPGHSTGRRGDCKEDGLQHCLELPSHPRSVAQARRWMRDVMRHVGREDLTETAELATSELVTNAVLHARTDISVVVDADGTDLVVEIRDGSAVAPTLPTIQPGETTADPVTLPSVGNGLLILAAVTRSWGVREEPGVGKAVWFVPAPDSGDPLAPLSSTDGEPRGAGEIFTVLLRDAPILELWTEMSRCRDLARELSLVLLGGTQDPALADAQQFMRDYVTDEDDWRGLRDAYARSESATTLHMCVQRSRVGFSSGFEALLDRLDDLSRADDLLTVPASDRASAVRSWVLTEVVRQDAGQAPQPWRG